MKTNAARFLDMRAIAYVTLEYSVDIEALRDAETAQKALGMAPEQIFKTLLLESERGYLFAVLPIAREIDLKAFARLSGNKRVQPAKTNELIERTGYARGSVTALAAKKAYPVALEETALSYALISVSAGMKGVSLTLSPTDYLRATNGTTGRFMRENPR